MIPEIITAQDALLYVDTTDAPTVRDALVPGVHAQPLFLDPQQGIWVLRVTMDAGITLPTHFHTGQVHVWTTAGSWNYLEHANEPQTAGCYLYEPGGSIHTFHTKEGTEFTTMVIGSNVNFDQDGNFLNIMDAGWIEEMINRLAKEQGLSDIKYVRGAGAGIKTVD